MSRKVMSWAGVFFAVACFTFGSSDAEARNCRCRRTRCCQQTSYQGCQQGWNGCQQIGNRGYYSNTQQTTYATTAGCPQPSTWNSRDPNSGVNQPMDTAPAPIGSTAVAPTATNVSPPSPGG